MLSGTLHGSLNQPTGETLALDEVGIITNVRGLHRVTFGRQELVLNDGEAAVGLLAEAGSFTHLPPGDVIALRVPRMQIAPLVAKLDDCLARRIPAGTPALRLLTGYLRLAEDRQAIACSDAQHLFVQHVYDLMAAASGATRDAAEVAEGRGLRAARLHAIKQDIGKNLDQLDLSVATIADRHRCTSRFVQRLFEGEGTTFTEYVLSQRLARAHRLLTDPRRDGEKISAVAYDCGFADVSYFNRAFRRHYGAAPSDVRAEARQS
jgi:AraC-like DNA-binding protein